jgi:hypothetical protein
MQRILPRAAVAVKRGARPDLRRADRPGSSTAEKCLSFRPDWTIT